MSRNDNLSEVFDKTAQKIICLLLKPNREQVMQSTTPITTSEAAESSPSRRVYPKSVPRNPAYKMMLQRLCLEVVMEDTVEIKIR